MKRILSLLYCLWMVILVVSANSSDFQHYVLDNGLTVYLWNDNNAKHVHGQVVVNVGSVDEPLDYTGLAHYLEHMLFKGTEKIGAVDWQKEKPFYDKVVKLYDQLNAETDKAKREELIKAINDASIEAAKWYQTDEFSNLTQGYGGTNLNANTSADRTVYFNEFQSENLEQWLMLNSERLINPVFRSFQAELENVFEEFNMYQDMKQTHFTDFLFKNVYSGNAYSRNTIGYPEHLKNPSLSSLIKFYNDWYVPENMALILVGDFDTEIAKPLINKYFGRMQKKSMPNRAKYNETDFSGNPKFSASIADYPQMLWVYNGVSADSKDRLLLDFVVKLFNNAHGTGVFDKINADGEVSMAYLMQDNRRYAGRLIFQCVPYFDMAQNAWESFPATEKLIMASVDKIKNGDIPEWLFKSVKQQMQMGYSIALEHIDPKVDALTEAFIYNQNPEDIFTERSRIDAITIDDVKACAKKYLDADYMTFKIEKGEPKKLKLNKPSIKPIEMPKGVESDFAKHFKKINVAHRELVYNDFSDVSRFDIYNGVRLWAVENTQNDVFSLTLKYGVGVLKMPKLEYAAALLNSAGIAPNVDGEMFRRQLSELGGSVSYKADNDYLYVNISGLEVNLQPICHLVMRQMLMPNLNEKQIKSTISGAYFTRMNEKNDSETTSDALLEYVILGNESKYIKRIPISELYSVSHTEGGMVENILLDKTQLTSTIQEAVQYEVDIHFCGTTNVVDLANMLKSNVPIAAQAKISESPMVRNKQIYDNTKVFFLPNSKVQQATVFFYMPLGNYSINDDMMYKVFNEYFSGGFSGLVMNEIREKRSMAYSAYGVLTTPARPNVMTYMYGYIGTQNDKVADAVDVYMNLVNDMPDYPERISNIKTAIHRSYAEAKPSMRAKSQVFDRWMRMGYSEDPAKSVLPKLANLTYDQLRDFYKQKIQNKPTAIVIMGDPKLVNQKQLKQKYGKIQKLNVNQLFKGGF